jgi:hypothetical protein
MDSLVGRFSGSPFVNPLRTFGEGHVQFVKPTFPWGLQEVNSSRDQLRHTSTRAHPILPRYANLPFHQVHGPIWSLSRLRVESL